MPTDPRRVLAAGLQHHRRRTLALLEPLDDDAVHRQHDRIMSPLVWDLGHIGNFEELCCCARSTGERRLTLTSTGSTTRSRTRAGCAPTCRCSHAPTRSPT